MKKFFLVVVALIALSIATPLVSQAQSLGEKEARRAEEATRAERQAMEELIRIIYGVKYPSPKFSVAYGLNGGTVQINPLGSPPAKEEMNQENLEWLHDHMRGYHETLTPQAVREFARRLLFAEAVFRDYARNTKEETADRFNVSSEFVGELWDTYLDFYKRKAVLPPIPSGARVKIKLP